jgi:diadenosine tetraphosphate (Ap4A) HIT family hydrolase
MESLVAGMGTASRAGGVVGAVPHVHTHIVPRYPDDPTPGRPLPGEVFRSAPTLSAEDLATQLTHLGRHLA